MNGFGHSLKRMPRYPSTPASATLAARDLQRV
jgi:hypothetical protein